MNNRLGNPFADSGEYRHKNVELMPQIFSDILVYLYDGSQFKRREAIKEVIAFHIEHGGLTQKDDYVPAFKKACQMPLKGYISNVAHGIWCLQYNASDGIIEVKTSKKATTKAPFSVDEELGEGSGAVYVYYYDVYRDRALLKGDTHWECKVGMTDQNTMGRIYSQAGTAYPEYPHVALVIKCSSAHDMETALHSVLKVQGKWIESAPGKEWFITSPDEIKDIYIGVLGGTLHKDKESTHK